MGGTSTLNNDWPLCVGPSVRTDAPVLATAMAHGVPPIVRLVSLSGGLPIVAAGTTVVAIFIQHARHCNSRGLDGRNPVQKC